MIQECQAVIDWLQVAAVSMLMCNLFLAGLATLAIVEMRKMRQAQEKPHA